ncbi:MAG: hypothetical protein LGB78_09845 [Sulfurovum sp.]|nr:hypothetical protein [Sulfurovum sp.]MCB4764177.1 hypothetical protein [Sulfurovum sp.]MCB4764654.1 hypothetical protein [Sulfurovum sp.]MCB4773531.1 hypothetical protein [Sulfurovum sp.]
MILKIGNLLSLLLAEAWFINSPDWEPAILFIGLFGTLITQELQSTHSSDKLSQKEKLEALYIKVHEMLEELIKTTKSHKKTDLNSKFSKLTAEVRMVASPSITKKYNYVADLYNNWASLYIKAYPKPKNGIQILYSSNSDSTKKYQEPEKEAYEKFYQEYENLINEMQSEIQNET